VEFADLPPDTVWAPARVAQGRGDARSITTLAALGLAHGRPVAVHGPDAPVPPEEQP
jgi:hypothetical protein